MKKKVVFSLVFFILLFNTYVFAVANQLDIASVHKVSDKEKYYLNMIIPTVKSDNGNAKNIFDKIRNDIDESSKEVINAGANDSFAPKGYFYTKFQVLYNKDDLLSLTVDNYKNLGGAHGLSNLVPYNYNIKTGKELFLGDLFKSNYDYKGFIDKFIRTEIAKNPDNYFDKGAMFKGISDNQGFYFSSEGITIFFELYQIAPYASGFPKFIIPLNQVSEHMSVKIY